MSVLFPELDTARMTVDHSTRERHMSAITVALREHRKPRVRRLRLLALAAALILLLPVLALAAENSVPGDFLYPIKRVVEPIVGVVDEDVEAQHRVAEVERMVDQGASADAVVDHAEEARLAVADRDPDLVRRIDEATEELTRRSDDGHAGAAAGAGEDPKEGDGKERPIRSEPTTTTAETETTTSHATDTSRPRDGRDG